MGIVFQFNIPLNHKHFSLRQNCWRIDQFSTRHIWHWMLLIYKTPDTATHFAVIIVWRLQSFMWLSLIKLVSSKVCTHLNRVMHFEAIVRLNYIKICGCDFINPLLKNELPGSRPTAPRPLIVWRLWHDDAIKWKHFPRYWPFLLGKSTGHRWIPLTMASDTELWCFLWSAPKQTVEQTLETPVIWDAIALIMTSLQWHDLFVTSGLFYGGP